MRILRSLLARVEVLGGTRVVPTSVKRRVRAGWLARRREVITSEAVLVVCFGQSFLQHAVVVTHHGGELGVEIKEGIVFAHGLAICPGKLGSQGADAVVQFLNLRLAQDGARGLGLKAVDQRGEEIDVFGLDWRQLVVVFRQDKRRRWRVTFSRGLLLQGCRMLLLLLLHIGQRRRNCSLEIIILLLGLMCCRGPAILLRRVDGRLCVTLGMALDFLQTHGERLLEVLVISLIDAGISWLHRGGTARLVGVSRRGVRTSCCRAPSSRLVLEFGVAPVVDTNSL